MGRGAKITRRGLCLMSVYNNEGCLESALWALEAKVVFILFLELHVLASPVLQCKHCWRIWIFNFSWERDFIAQVWLFTLPQDVSISFWPLFFRLSFYAYVFPLIERSLLLPPRGGELREEILILRDMHSKPVLAGCEFWRSLVKVFSPVLILQAWYLINEKMLLQLSMGKQNPLY